MDALKLFIENSSPGYVEYFKNLKFEIVEDYKEAEAICFTGGTDISPMLYNELPNAYTEHSDFGRDQYCINVFQYAYENGLPCIGICRGSQFLTAMAGGKLIQHVNNHGRSHKMNTATGSMICTSTHHQMMYPFNLEKNEYTILGWADEATDYIGQNEDHYTNINLVKDFVEPEAVYYPHINAVAMQYHPEYGNATKELKHFSKDIINRLLDGTLAK